MECYFMMRMDFEVQPEVLVYASCPQGIKQPGTFRCCPLGVQFYSHSDIPMYSVMEIKLDFPVEDQTVPIDCSGVVVYSEFDKKSGMYRIWVTFLDLDEEKKKRLKCLGKCTETLCPHCENY